MKRASYVDRSGNAIDHSFESKKTFLRIFFVIGTVIPVIIIGFIIYTMIDNTKCQNVYKVIENAAHEYLKDNGIVPTFEGESETVKIDKLYSGKFLSSGYTNDLTCSGKVKVTKYKNELVYTIDLQNCGTCSTNNRYNTWSAETKYYPANKTVIDVIPYYNYYERQISTTDWSKEFEEEELEKKPSKYGVRMPNEENIDRMPEVPTEGNIVEVQASESTEYRYRDKQWLWYDIKGNYSDFSSEQPSGFANKDESTKIYSEWSEYSLNHPEEKDYRDIQSITGYKYYYEKGGKKVYANNGKYTAPEDVDQTKYTNKDSDTSTLYRYRDSKWRWYNGQKRRYSSYRSNPTNGYPYRDIETEKYTSYSSWSKESKLTSANQSYREEETKQKTKLRYVYEILSLKVLDKEINQQQFIEQTGMTAPEFAALENYKLEVTYKFKYRKR